MEKLANEETARFARGFVPTRLNGWYLNIRR